MDYDLEEYPAARGGQGLVYFGTRSDGLAIAVKVAGSSTRSQAELPREAAVMRALGGVPGIVPCLDEITLHGRPALVMPRYPETLASWLERVAFRPDADTLGQVLSVTAQVARTLAAVHAFDLAGSTVVHRDIKPENIFLDHKGHPWIGDFGGAMAIDALREVELALFGTPMWAPLDQILPGRAMPDPTWDTYGLCVVLYAALTAARPAYQADPRQLLTARGRDLWETASRAISSEGLQRQSLRQAFSEARKGTAASDLVDVTGRGALNHADRQVLDARVAMLAGLAGVTELLPLQRGLWSLLSRGLSPVSHPSPPNRFRDAGELADLLDDLTAVCRKAPAAAPTRQVPSRDQIFSGPMADAPDIALDEAPDYAPRSEPIPLWPLLALLAVVGLAAAAWALWPQPAPDRLPLASGVQLDRLEVTGARWDTLSDLPRPGGPAALPVVGVTLAQAKAFCASLGGRLPTDAEWEEAATFDWSLDDATCEHANALGCGGDVLPPGSAPLGASVTGFHDLAGNVWEWTSEGHVRGGSAQSPKSDVGRGGRRTPGPATIPELTGLRCAYP